MGAGNQIWVLWKSTQYPSFQPWIYRVFKGFLISDFSTPVSPVRVFLGCQGFKSAYSVRVSIRVTIPIGQPPLV